MSCLFSLAGILTVSLGSSLAAPPPNDTCEGAVMVPSSAVLPYLTEVITNVSAATMVNDPSPPTTCYGGTDPVFHGIWFVYQPNASGNYTFSVSGDTATTLPDTAMAIYSSAGNCQGSLLACNDDSGDRKSAIHLALTSGVTYYVVVWSILPGEPGEDSVQLRVSRPVVPSNNTCDTPEFIPSSGPFPHFTSTNDITLATIAGDPPAPTCYADGRKSVWFRFNPTTSGTYLITTGPQTATTIFETVMAIYTSSTACSGFTQVACDYTQDSRAEITQNLTAGTRYHIVVWDADPESPTHGETALQLAVTLVAPPTVTTLPATRIGSTNATLHGSFTPNGLLTRTWFEWGTSTSYGNRTAPTRLVGSGVSPVLTNAVITGLTPGTTYHYRAVGTNSMGTNFGANATFVWTGTRPNITSLERQTATSYRLRFNAVSGQIYRVEASENLINWADLGEAQDVGGSAFEFLDATAPAQRRFYRVKAP
jgi:hypothetical protein